jgi:hypothetical protein
MCRFIALLLVSVVLVGASPASAQEPSPTALPTLDGIDGLADAAVRSFEASGIRLIGTAQFSFMVVRFDDVEAARSGIERVIANQIARIDQQSDVSDLKRASIGSIGDETLAHAGEVVVDDPGDAAVEPLIVGIVAARRAAYVQLGQGVALAGDPLVDVSGVLKKTIDRAEGGDATPVDGDGMRTGGLWDMLPRLEDLPEGFVLDEERVPAPFDPLPEPDVTQSPTTTDNAAELPSQTPKAAAGSRSEPIAFGHSARVAGDWSVRVVRTFGDPHQIDPSADWFNDWLDHNPLPAGQQMFTVRLRLTNRGGESAFPDRVLWFVLVGSFDYTYGTVFHCGTVPGELSFTDEVAPGESLVTNLCWIVLREDVGSLVLYAEPLFSFDEGNRVYFVLE